MYSKRALIVRFALGLAVIVVALGLWPDWAILPWTILVFVIVWVLNVALLRSRGQIGSDGPRFANLS
jgi:hypothetical protein